MCYCSNSLPFEQCCEPFILGKQVPETAEQLMRSRYSAYATDAAEYIRNTYAKKEQVNHPASEISAFAQFADFIKLEVVRTEQGSEYDYVEFIAHYLAQHTHHQLHERSRFIKEHDQWRYLDGELYEVPEVKLSRNDVCPCGSNKKYKKCHGK